MIFTYATDGVDFRTIEMSERLSQWKILMTPSEIETSTFQVLAQCLNQLHHCASPTSHPSLEWSMTLMYVLGFYLLPLHLSLELSMALIPAISLSFAVIYVLELTCNFYICPWPYTRPWYLSLSLHWPWYLSLALHVILISVLGLTRDLDTCPWPYTWPWYMSLALHWPWYLSLALHVTLISVLGLTCDLDICPWPYTWPWYMSLALHWPWYLSLALHVTLISVLGLTCDLDICLSSFSLTPRITSRKWGYFCTQFSHRPYVTKIEVTKNQILDNES